MLYRHASPYNPSGGMWGEERKLGRLVEGVLDRAVCVGVEGVGKGPSVERRALKNPRKPLRDSGQSIG